MDAVEDAFFNVRIIPLQAADQGLDFLPFGAAATVITNGAVFREAAGTLNEFQLIVSFPGDNIVLSDTVHGTDEFHTLKIGAVQLGKHRLKLRTVKHSHNGSFNHIVEVISQSDFIAAQFLGFAV